MLKCKSGWLEGAKRVLSPNCNERPDEQNVSLLVIHNISLPPGEFGGGYVERFFSNDLPIEVHPFFEEIKGLQVSAHCFISREGEVTQFVPLNQRAWHAGVSRFDGCEGCNDFSIGIELEGTDEIEYTQAQYQALVELTKSIQSDYPLITEQRIVGHSDIAPGRKTDPGVAFDWAYYRSKLSES